MRSCLICIIFSCPAGSFTRISRVFLQDFLIMFVHHLATISLISFSYVNNMLRVGSLVMCVHDTSDFLLEVRTHNNAFTVTLFWVIFSNQHLTEEQCVTLHKITCIHFFPQWYMNYWFLNQHLIRFWSQIAPTITSILIFYSVLHGQTLQNRYI